MAKSKKTTYLPAGVAQTLVEYMEQCGYAQGGIRMRLGNLNFLFSHYGEPKMMEMLQTSFEKVKETIKWIEQTLPAHCIATADLHAFKLAWESLNGIELFKKRVRP